MLQRVTCSAEGLWPAEEQMRLHADVDRAHEQLKLIERTIADGSQAFDGRSEIDRMLDM